MPANLSPLRHIPVSLLLSTSLLLGCSHHPTPITAEVRQQLGKVYLNSAGLTEKTFLNGDFPSGGMSGAMGGAGKGAAQGMDRCLDATMSSAQLAPLVLVVCTALILPADIYRGSVAGGQPTMTPAAVADMEKRTNDALRSANLSLALVSTIDDIGQRNARLAEHEMTHNTLPAPQGNETIASVAARWGYQTVMEVQVLSAGLESSDSSTPMLHLAMTARVNLIEAASGKSLLQQNYEFESQAQPIKYWFEDDYGTLSRAIVQANKQLADDIVNNVFLK